MHSAACTNGWPSGRKCHCTTCCQTFSCVSNFDKHRENDKCLPPASVGLAKNAHGVWITPDETDYVERFKRD